MTFFTLQLDFKSLSAKKSNVTVLMILHLDAE